MSGEDVHVVVLEQVVQLPQVGPALVVEVAVADGGDDEHAPFAHDAPVADDLGGQGLHHLDGVGAHAVAVVEVGACPKDDDVVLLLRPVDVGALVRLFRTRAASPFGPLSESRSGGSWCPARRRSRRTSCPSSLHPHACWSNLCRISLFVDTGTSPAGMTQGCGGRRCSPPVEMPVAVL